ncbi:MAG: pyridoxamine 5'-phosphate oxidase family protein [Actinomycetota bacterium]
MADRFPELSPELAEWWRAQPVFFVATAPVGATGHVNCSPKGLDTLRILDPDRLAYLDLTGSGAETIAHIRENGRITLMACAFTGPPRISRIYGRATVHPVGSDSFAALADGFPELPGARAQVTSRSRGPVSSISGTPYPHEVVTDSTAISFTARAQGEAGLAAYRARKNARSLDGLPGVDG